MSRSRLALFIPTIALLVIAPAVGRAAESRGQTKHVVLVVWDGMRPDFVTEKNTPNLWKLAHEGVTFRDHHSVYPSLTNVNGTVLATGVYPGRSGVIGNAEFRPAIDPANPVDTAADATIQKGDAISGDKYLAAPTIAELVQASGARTAVAGTKWISTLFDRARDRSSETAQNSPVVTAGQALPDAEKRALLDSLGKFPAKQFPNNAQDRWTTAALTASFWKDGVPTFSLLWLSDPDFTEHESAPGSPSVLAGIKHSDLMLGNVVDALEANHVRAETDIFVVSDHGFSTVERAVDLPAVLRAAGFKATNRFEAEPGPGMILIVGNGGTTFFYVTGHDEAVTRRLVEWLQRSDFASVIFSQNKIEGAFSLGDAHLEKEGGPDVIMSFRWNEKSNQFGAPGMIFSDAARAAGKGTHATLSKFDLHNILFATGPDFRKGYEDKLPSGNIDVAPTILHILGLTPKAGVDGRVLSEAMLPILTDLPEVKTELMAESRKLADGEWRQAITISKVGEQRYFDEGSGGLTSTTR